MTLIAIFFPFLSFLFRGKILTSIICLILQITLIGWITAAIWTVLSLQNSRSDIRNEKLMKAVNMKQPSLAEVFFFVFFFTNPSSN